MTWTHTELSRLLLERGRTSCDQYIEHDTYSGFCQTCGEDYEAHLTKHAAEEIGAFEAKLHFFAEMAVRMRTEALTPGDWGLVEASTVIDWANEIETKATVSAPKHSN